MDIGSVHLGASLRFDDPIAVVALPCPLELGGLLALTRLKLALLRIGLRDPLLILLFLGARLPGSSLVESSPLSVLDAASRVAVVRTRLGLGSDLPVLILAVVVIVLPALCLRRRGDEKERCRRRKYLNSLHRFLHPKRLLHHSVPPIARRVPVPAVS